MGGLPITQPGCRGVAGCGISKNYKKSEKQKRSCGDLKVTAGHLGLFFGGAGQFCFRRWSGGQSEVVTFALWRARIPPRVAMDFAGAFATWGAYLPGRLCLGVRPQPDRETT